MKEKTYVEDVDRSMYDFRNEDKDAYKVKEGLNPAIVEQISNEKHDPEWMKEFRMKSLEIFNNSTMPDEWLSLIHISEPTRPYWPSRMPSSA